MKNNFSAAGMPFAFFCIGFTIAVLGSLLIGRGADIEFGLLLGSAMAVGRTIGIIMDYRANAKLTREAARG